MKKFYIWPQSDPLILVWANGYQRSLKGRVVLSPGIQRYAVSGQQNRPAHERCLTSSHAKAPNFDLIMSLSKVFMVTDQKVGPYEIIRGC